MPPELLVDLEGINLDTVVFDREAIDRLNPQRYEMRQLDGVNYFDAERNVIVGYKDVGEDEFWVRGHLPGRPILPGVIMIEAAAQMVSFAVKKFNNDDRFIGFGGIDQVKFRGTVTPPCRLTMIGKMMENRPRRFSCDTQGIVAGAMVFQARIIGMPV